MNKITRKKRSVNFTVVNNDIPNNPSLSWKAKGILLYLLSRPDDWEVYVAQLSKVGKDGRDGTATGLKELIEAGYILRTVDRDKNGKFAGYNYVVSDEPEYLNTENGKSVNGKTVNGESENGKSVTTKKGSNQELKEVRKEDNGFEEFWLKYHLVTGLSKTDKKQTIKYWNKLTKVQRKKAVDRIEAYAEANPKYRKKARTYLSSEAFEDEFKKQVETSQQHHSKRKLNYVN